MHPARDGAKTYRYFPASVGLKGISVWSQHSPKLDTVIDWHMGLVLLRRRFLNEFDAGKSFDQALDRATEQLIRERKAADAPVVTLRFSCRRVTDNRLLDLDE